MVKLNQTYGLGSPVQNSYPLPVISNRDPTTRDTNFARGQLWVNKSSNTIYSLSDVVSAAANWVSLGSGTGVETFPITPFVVGLGGNAGFTTIQSALDAADSAGGGMVYLQPGTYTEDLVFFDKTQLVSVEYVDVGNTIVIGVHTPPTSGTVAIRGIRVVSPSSVFFSTEAGSTDISFIECTFGVQDGWVFDLENWTGTFNINDCGSQSSIEDGVINNTGGSDIFTNNCQVGAGTTRVFTSSGDVRLDLTFMDCPISISSGAIFINFALFAKTLTIEGDATGSIVLGDFFPGSDPAIVMDSTGDVSIANTSITSSNDPAIDGSGSGTLTLGQLTFLDNGNISGSLTTDFGSESFFGPMTINGNILMPQPSTQLQMEGGADTDFIGQVTLTTGTATVSNTNISSTDKIFLQREGIGASTDLGVLDISITDSTSFTITSLRPGNPGSTETDDLSIINYFIVRQN